jgi:hypothetical protein
MTMIEKLFNHPHVLHQKTDGDDLPEYPIAASIDSGGLICISQEGRNICINPESVGELNQLLVRLKSLV